MKKALYIYLLLLVSNSLFAQEKTEIIYLFFDSKKNNKCIIENGSGKKIKTKFYQKQFKKDRTIFHICDEKFFFNPREQKTDTCSIRSLKKINIKTLDFIKDKYYKGNDFKHHTFKQINIVEKISETKIVKYFNVHWCCEWTIED